MDIKLVLAGAFVCQLLAAVIALLLNRRYRQRSAWTLISAAAIVMAVRPLASLVIIWSETSPDTVAGNYLWTESIASLLIAILFLAGIAMIEPLFKDLAQAEELLRREKSALEKSVAATEHEMNVARAIQRSLLPDHLPQVEGLEVAGSSEPAEWTSGDYFDYFRMDNGALLSVVADVSGHGTGPALLMTETRAYFRALAQTHDDVGEILTLTNRALANDIAFGQFVTMFAARLDPQKREMTYASAGQDAYLLRADGALTVLESSSPPLGVVGDKRIASSKSVPLQAGDLLLLITDGLNETRNPAREQWGVDGVLSEVRALRELSPAALVKDLFQKACEFRQNTPQEDDNTAVVIKVL